MAKKKIKPFPELVQFLKKKMSKINLIGTHPKLYAEIMEYLRGKSTLQKTSKAIRAQVDAYIGLMDNIAEIIKAEKYAYLEASRTIKTLPKNKRRKKVRIIKIKKIDNKFNKTDKKVEVKQSRTGTRKAGTKKEKVVKEKVVKEKKQAVKKQPSKKQVKKEIEVRKGTIFTDVYGDKCQIVNIKRNGIFEIKVISTAIYSLKDIVKIVKY